MGNNKKSRFHKLFNPLGLTIGKKGTIKSSIKKQRITWRRFLKWGLLALGVILIALGVMVVIFSKDLPTPEQLAQFQLNGSTKILDRNGNLLYDVHGVTLRILVSSQDIPTAAKDATIAIEDKDFYHEPGINIKSIIRAAVVDVLSHSKAQGASTITQQLIRNSFSTVGTEKTYIRKLKEVVLAIEFDHLHSKDQILTLYLNAVPYGDNYYGIEAAAEGYYGTSIKDMNPDNVSNIDDKAKIYAHLATLAAMLQAPTYYNPNGNHTDALQDRRNTDLQDMIDQGYLSKEIGDKAMTVSISDGITQPSNNIIAPHFVFYVREQLVNMLGGGQVGERRLDSEGLTVTTTLDLQDQKAAEQAIAKDTPAIFRATKATNAALVSINAENGQMLAMVGSVDYNNPQFGAVNVTTSLRQPGSSFKPIVYATLFNQGWSPGDTLFDLESSYDESRPTTIWPVDYSGHGQGPVTIRSALAESLNIPAVKALAIAGVNNSINTAKSLGISTLGPASQYGLSMVLGSAEVKMTDMVGAYDAFANNGTFHPVSSILKIVDSSGKTIEQWHDQPKQVLNPDVAYEITNILSDNNARAPEFGYHSDLILNGRPVAAKTGTTDDYKDAWTIGYTPQVATAVWVGNNNEAQMTHSGAGAMAAAPIWHDYMTAVSQNMPVENFVQPSGIEKCQIARFSNKKPTSLTPSSQIINDICDSAQLPTQPDSSNVAVKVYKLNPNELATDQTPPALVETKVFTVIHSERPSDPFWENPVEAWAKANGYNTQSIPTTNYNPNTNDKLTVSITSPNNNASISGPVTLQANPVSPFGVTSVSFSVDNQQITKLSSSPWSYLYDPSQLTPGQHTLTVTATDGQGQTATTTSSFTFVSNVPFAINNVSANRSTDQTSVTITWTTTQVANGEVLYGPVAGNYSFFQSESNDSSTNHVVTITGLAPGVTYHYIVQDTSSVGNNTISNSDSTF